MESKAAKRARAIRIIKELSSLFAEATADKPTGRALPPPMTQLIKRDFGQNPFLILVSCLLSLRSRDTQTYPVSVKLFNKVRTPAELAPFPLNKLEQIIKPIGFYKRKAQIIKGVSQELLDRFNGQVPQTKEELLSLKGVGLKTANLVLAEAFDIPAICVDVHVHRLANEWGLVKTKTPEQTEVALQELLPKKYWIAVNRYFVFFGQHKRAMSAALHPSTPLRMSGGTDSQDEWGQFSRGYKQEKRSW